MTINRQVCKAVLWPDTLQGIGWTQRDDMLAPVTRQWQQYVPTYLVQRCVSSAASFSFLPQFVLTTSDRAVQVLDDG